MHARGCASQLLTGDFAFALFFRVPDWFGALHLREFLPPINIRKNSSKAGPAFVLGDAGKQLNLKRLAVLTVVCVAM
jgi:hypothetical protein